jgi:hypothetical protein
VLRPRLKIALREFYGKQVPIDATAAEMQQLALAYHKEVL